MKKIYFTFLFVYFTFNFQAQSWCTPGSTWYYEFAQPATGYVKYTYLYDTLVGTDMCNKIRTESHGYSWGGSPVTMLTIYTQSIIME